MCRLMLLCSAALAACGSSETPNPGPTYQVVGAAAGFGETADCLFSATYAIGASIAVVDVTDYASPAACDSMTSNTVPANGAAAGLVIVRAAFAAPPAAPAPGLVAETYPFYDLATLAQGKFPPFDAGGKAAFFTGGFLKCGATGGGSSAPVSGGTVTVTSVSATHIAGSVSASLAGGGTVTGSFSADLCGGAPALDVCAAIQARSLNLSPPTCG